MNSFEFILIFSCLLGVLALFVPLIHDHEQNISLARETFEKNGFILGCSSLLDAASTHYLVVDPHSCTDYSFSLHSPSHSFLSVLGRDANHYG